jgi:hypothetical protein
MSPSRPPAPNALGLRAQEYHRRIAAFSRLDFSRASKSHPAPPITLPRAPPAALLPAKPGASEEVVDDADEEPSLPARPLTLDGLPPGAVPRDEAARWDSRAAPPASTKTVYANGLQLRSYQVRRAPCARNARRAERGCRPRV